MTSTSITITIHISIKCQWIDESKISIEIKSQHLKGVLGSHLFLGDPDDRLFEPTMSWLNWLMKVYGERNEKSDIILP